MKIVVLLGSMIFGPFFVSPDEAVQTACLRAIRGIQSTLLFRARAGEFECKIFEESPEGLGGEK